MGVVTREDWWMTEERCACPTVLIKPTTNAEALSNVQYKEDSKQ
jgi:hypothetical protein